MLSNPRLEFSLAAQAETIVLPEAEDSVVMHLLVPSILFVDLINLLTYHDHNAALPARK